MIATTRAQRPGTTAGEESGGPRGAAGAGSPPVERDAHVGSDVEGELDDGAVVGGSVAEDAVSGGRADGRRGRTQGAEQPVRQGRQFPLSKRVPASSLLRDEAFMADDGSDSSEDERPPKNTVGDVPLEWYQHEEHIGYDRRVPTIENCSALSPSATQLCPPHWRTKFTSSGM